MPDGSPAVIAMRGTVEFTADQFAARGLELVFDECLVAQSSRP